MEYADVKSQVRLNRYVTSKEYYKMQEGEYENARNKNGKSSFNKK